MATPTGSCKLEVLVNSARIGLQPECDIEVPLSEDSSKREIGKAVIKKSQGWDFIGSSEFELGISNPYADALIEGRYGTRKFGLKFIREAAVRFAQDHASTKKNKTNPYFTKAFTFTLGMRDFYRAETTKDYHISQAQMRNNNWGFMIDRPINISGKRQLGASVVWQQKRPSGEGFNHYRLGAAFADARKGDGLLAYKAELDEFGSCKMEEGESLCYFSEPFFLETAEPLLQGVYNSLFGSLGYENSDGSAQVSGAINLDTRLMMTEEDQSTALAPHVGVAAQFEKAVTLTADATWINNEASELRAGIRGHIKADPGKIEPYATLTHVRTIEGISFGSEGEFLTAHDGGSVIITPGNNNRRDNLNDTLTTHSVAAVAGIEYIQKFGENDQHQFRISGEGGTFNDPSIEGGSTLVGGGRFEVSTKF